MKISQLAAYQNDCLTGGDLLELGPVTVDSLEAFERTLETVVSE